MTNNKEHPSRFSKTRHFSKRARIYLFALLTISLSCISIIFKPLPIFWMLLALSFFFLYLVKSVNHTFYKALYFNTGAILFILTIFELIFTIIDYAEKKKSPEIILEHVYDNVQDDILGNTLIKNTTRNARKFHNGKLLYDVVITVDSNSLRISPPCIGPCTKSILFFGDSFTFGEGVNDDETMPYKVGLELNGEYAVYNFAAPANGTHQVLSAIEHGLVSNIVKNEACYAIYQLLYPGHIRRLRGQWDWNKHGPRYELDKNNIPVMLGHFDDDSIQRKYRVLSEYSVMAQKIMNFKMPLNNYDKALFVAMLIRSKELLQAKYPHIEFHLIIWGWTEGAEKKIFDALEEKGFQLHYIRDILPDMDKLNLTYRLSEYDRHPNAFAYSIMAKYVTSSIVDRKSAI